MENTIRCPTWSAMHDVAVRVRHMAAHTEPFPAQKCAGAMGTQSAQLDRMARRVALAIVVAAGTFGCGGDTSGAKATDAATDAASGAPGTLPDGGSICPGTLPDGAQGIMLISSLFNLSPAFVCGEVFGYDGNGVANESAPCAGSVMVEIGTGVDTSAWWLFDAKTGDLEAVGGFPASDPNYIGCVAARPGFVFPTQCDNNGRFPGPGVSDLCPDAGADAATDSGPLDAGGE